MYKKTLLLVLLLVFTASLLAGCGTSEGDKFLGKWVDGGFSKGDKRYLEISTKDNKTFAVNFINEDGTVHMKNTATLKDTYLEVNAFERITLSPDNTFTFRSGDFSKVK